jgi:hypothetical protein
MERHQSIKQRSFSLTLSLIYGGITCFITLISIYSKFWFEKGIVMRLEKIELGMTNQMKQIEGELQSLAVNQQKIPSKSIVEEPEVLPQSEPEVKPEVGELNPIYLHIGLCTVTALSTMILLRMF